MPNRIMRGELPTHGDESFPFIAHETRLGFDLLLKNLFGFEGRQIVHDRGAGVARGRADCQGARSRTIARTGVFVVRRWPLRPRPDGGASGCCFGLPPR